MAYDIINEKYIIIPNHVIKEVGSIFSVNNIQYIIYYISNYEIKVMPKQEYIKRVKVELYDGQYRTLLEIEKLNENKLIK